MEECRTESRFSGGLKSAAFGGKKSIKSKCLESFPVNRGRSRATWNSSVGSFCTRLSFPSTVPGCEEKTVLSRKKFTGYHSAFGHYTRDEAIAAIVILIIRGVSQMIYDAHVVRDRFRKYVLRPPFLSNALQTLPRASPSRLITLPTYIPR